MATVKGAWLSDYVKMIKVYLKNMEDKDIQDKQRRFNKLLPINERLTAEDWKIINELVLPSVKYNYDSFQRIGNAVFKIVAKSQLNLVRIFGQAFMNALLELYKNLLVEEDPIRSIEKFTDFHKLYFQEVESMAKLIGQTPNSATVELALNSTDNRYPAASQAFAYQLGGGLEQLVANAKGFESLEGAGVNLRITEEGKGRFLYYLSW